MASDDNPRGPVHPRAYANRHDAERTQSERSPINLPILLIAAGIAWHLQPHRLAKALVAQENAPEVEVSVFTSLRHTAVSLLKDAGVPDAVVMASSRP